MLHLRKLVPISISSVILSSIGSVYYNNESDVEWRIRGGIQAELLEVQQGAKNVDETAAGGGRIIAVADAIIAGAHANQTTCRLLLGTTDAGPTPFAPPAAAPPPDTLATLLADATTLGPRLQRRIAALVGTLAESLIVEGDELAGAGRASLVRVGGSSSLARLLPPGNDANTTQPTVQAERTRQVVLHSIWSCERAGAIDDLPEAERVRVGRALVAEGRRVGRPAYIEAGRRMTHGLAAPPVSRGVVGHLQRSEVRSLLAHTVVGGALWGAGAAFFGPATRPALSVAAAAGLGTGFITTLLPVFVVGVGVSTYTSYRRELDSTASILAADTVVAATTLTPAVPLLRTVDRVFPHWLGGHILSLTTWLGRLRLDGSEWLVRDLYWLEAAADAEERRRWRAAMRDEIELATS